jgi:hypothetical protein
MTIQHPRTPAGRSPPGGSTERWRAHANASRRSNVGILLLVAAGFALTILVFQPGYPTLDARYVYGDAKAWNFADWQSPVMALLWWLIDPLAPGAWSMFLLIASLYWLGFGLLGLTVARRSAWLGLATPLLAFAPPAFFFVGIIWRDILFGVVWLVAAVLPFAVADRNAGSRIPLQIVALLMVGLGVLLRPNAIFAGAVLAIYALWPARFDLKRTLIWFVPAVAVCYALVPAVYYGLMGARHTNPLHSVMVFDLGGITHFTGQNQFPVTWSDAETALLTSGCYDGKLWDVYWYKEPCQFVMKRLERPDDIIFGTSRLSNAWRDAILAHPLAYLQHRATFMWNFLARPNLVLPYLDWEGPQATYGGNRFFRPLLDLHQRIEQAILFRPGLWLAMALAIAVVSWPARATPAGAFAIGVTTSAAIYVMTFFAVGVASDFRYAYWCVLAVLAGAVAALAAWHDRRAKP